MRIAMFDSKPYDIESFQKLNNPSIEYTFFEEKLSCKTIKLAEGYDGVIVFVNDNINEEVINKLNEMGIKLLLLRSAGYNNVDLYAAKDKIKVYRVPAYSPESVAEYAMALLLTSIRRTHKAYIRSRDFNFSLNGLVGFNLHNKTVGVIGTGKIGKAFINICKGFGMNILAFDKYPDQSLTDVKYVSLEELFKESDIISLHCPLTVENTYMINKFTINMMKKGVVIINTSRGGLVDTEALVEGIREKKVGAACLDVYEEESHYFYKDMSNHIVSDEVLSRLISFPNVIVTSHQGFLTREALDSIAKTTEENIISYMEGKESSNEVKYQE